MIANKVSGLNQLLSWTSSKSLLNGLKVNRLMNGCYSTTSTTTETTEPVEGVGDQSTSSKTTFSKAFDKYTGHENFTKLIRNSAFVRMGDPKGKLVEGVVQHIVDEDLYIDIGGKFNCVCLKPLENGSAYQVGTKVRVVLHDPELSTRFLGAVTDLTILEADGSLIGLRRRGQDQSTFENPEPPGKSITEQLLNSSSS